MTINEAISKIFDGNCILVVGSGFSSAAKNKAGENLPSAQELSALMDAESGENSEEDLGLSAENFIDTKGISTLITFLKDTLTPCDISEDQKTISKQNWKRIYTTNYDDIVEYSAREANIRLDGVCLSDNSTDYKNKRNIVVHINGKLEHLNENTLQDEFKLTNTSYLTTKFAESPWISLFQFDLKDCDAVFFVGLSLKYDLDIARLVYDGTIKDKAFFITHEEESESSLKRMSKLGYPCPIGMSEFANQIVESASHFVPPVKSTPNIKFSSFIPFELNSNRPSIDDNKLRQLLIWGDVKWDCIQFSLQEPHNYIYYIHRDRLENCINAIDNGEHYIAVNGNIGNGKTLFLMGLTTLLKIRGYNVFSFKEDTPKTFRELEQICSFNDNRTVIILENYTSHRDVVEKFSSLQSDAIFVVSERTAINDIHFDWLREKTQKDYYEVDLNTLSSNEIDNVIKLLDHVNLWGKLAGELNHKKIEFIKRDCRSELRGVLLYLLDTKPIKDHLEAIFSKLKNNTSFYKSLILVMMSSYTSFTIDIYDLTRAIDDGLINNSSFKRNEIVQEFIDFSTGVSKASSAVLAEVVLKNFVDAKVFIDTLIDAFMQFDKDNQKYRIALKSLMTYSSLIAILGNHHNEARKLIPDFYDNIKSCVVCRNNPHFWLQYAIAMLEDHDFPAAKIYFDNAYSYAKNKTQFNEVQIDNHYARFLLENAINNEDELFMESFQKAHTILTDPRYMKDKKYYPFKVARCYNPFYKKYKDSMDPQTLILFKQASAQIYDMLERYIANNAHEVKRHEIREAKEGLYEIINDSVTLKL